ncbi:MAG: high-potential iron-sulfur protein [Rhodothermales bacterium]|nr:high-potential iron-sulfur protein [Rhodothermales bacterium]MBO6778840.1 high-potential iron-sulfur protein [Rhodothermales bacterium]
MKRTSPSRRDFLKRFGAAGALSIGAGSVLAACGGGESAPQAEPEAAAAESAPEGCMDTSGLTEQEIGMRDSLQYVDTTPEEGKLCSNCSLWLPAPEGATCGGCNLLKGPIHPDGYCISWAPAQT